MSYAMALLQLEKKVYSNPKYVEIIEQSQQKILKQLSFFDIEGVKNETQKEPMKIELW